MTSVTPGDAQSSLVMTHPIAAWFTPARAEAPCPILAQSMANNYGAFVSTVPAFLNVVDFAHRLVGPKPLQYLSGAMNRMSNHLVPAWNPYMPRVRARATRPAVVSVLVLREAAFRVHACSEEVQAYKRVAACCTRCCWSHNDPSARHRYAHHACTGRVLLCGAGRRW